MPIYAYKCESCGHTKDVLQKMSDTPLSDCPACGTPAFKKQLTAAGFQLKGSGWYVTDFKGGNAAAKPGADTKADSTSTDRPAGQASDQPAAKPADAPKPAAATPAAAAPSGKAPSSS